MRPDIGRIDPGILVIVDELLGIHCLGVVAIERHFDRWRLQFRRELSAQRLDQFDRFGMRQQCAGRGIQIGAPARCAVHILLGSSGACICRIHLSVQALEFGERQFGGTAFRAGFFLSLGCRERFVAFSGKIAAQDVCCGVQIVLGVAADQFAILGEGHVTLDDPRAHPRCSDIGLRGMFWKLHWRTAMANRPE